MVTPVTWSCREKISGIISTPTATDFAFKKEPEPNFGSSEMAMSSTETPPENSARRMLPIASFAAERSSPPPTRPAA